MRGSRILKMAGMGVAFFAIVLIAAALFGLVVLHLWNWLMPALFGLPAVTYWQAIGLLILSWKELHTPPVVLESHARALAKNDPRGARSIPRQDAGVGRGCGRRAHTRKGVRHGRHGERVG